MKYYAKNHRLAEQLKVNLKRRNLQCQNLQQGPEKSKDNSLCLRSTKPSKIQLLEDLSKENSPLLKDKLTSQSHCDT